MNMKKVEIIINSPFITPLLSDTLFGHIAWALRYLKGEDYLEHFLNEFKESPPVLLSNVFPKGYLPKPVTEGLNENQINDLFNILCPECTEKSKFIEFLSVLKKLNKEKYIRIEDFEELKHNYSPFEYYSFIQDRIKNMMSNISKELEIKDSEKEIVSHNVINRISNGSDNFFQQEETYYSKDYKMEIYVSFREDIEQELRDSLEYISYNGFGKDASTGKGNFSVDNNFIECKSDNESGFNAVMSLSNFIPSENDSTDCLYNIMTKFGKLGGEYAQHPIDDDDKIIPWKKPLLMLTEGSVFNNNGKKIEYLGQMMNDVHSNQKIKHYAYALVIPINIKRE